MTKITISKGNSKMGAVPSVSLPPIKTCAPGCACAGKCYAAKICRIYSNVRQSYENNLMAYYEDPARYMATVERAAAMHRFFRWHVSGDILNALYLYDMCRIAERLPGTTFLAFTKRYDIVNAYAAGHTIPGNLKIIFSEWPGIPMENPHDFPVAHVIFRGSAPGPDWKICGGNCTECACQGVGCWELRQGEHIAFYEH